MFRLTDEINFFEIACMYIVMFQSSPAAPSCGQSGHSRRNKSTLFEGTKTFRTVKDCKHVLHTDLKPRRLFHRGIQKHTQL